MNTRVKLAALFGAAAMVLAMSSTALADGTISWTGQGVTDGQLNTEKCGTENGAEVDGAYLLWILTSADGVSAIDLNVNGDHYSDFTAHGGSIHVVTDFYDLDTISASLGFTGSLGDNAQLVISHGCPGEPQPTETPGESGGGATETPGESGAGATETPAGSLPNTATIGGNTNSPSDSSWLLVAALGVLLASVVVLTPARAKTRR
jgi:hypothetical protein